MKEYLNKLVNKLLRKKEDKRQVIEYALHYYQKTRDMKKNLQMFEQALQKIEAEFEPNKKEEIIGNIELAECYVYFRNGEYSFLERTSELEKKYGNPERAKALAEMVLKLKEEGRIDLNKVREPAKFKVLQEMMQTIKYNLSPKGRKDEYQKDWVSIVNRLEEELQKKGIALQDYGHNEEILQTYEEIISQENDDYYAWKYRKNLKELGLEPLNSEDKDEHKHVIVLEKEKMIIPVGEYSEKKSEQVQRTHREQDLER